MISFVFESLIFNLLLLIHCLMSERQLFTFEITSNGCLHLNEMYSVITHTHTETRKVDHLLTSLETSSMTTAVESIQAHIAQLVAY